MTGGFGERSASTRQSFYGTRCAYGRSSYVYLDNYYASSYDQKITSDPQNWPIFRLNFVDDFRYYKNPAVVAGPIQLGDQPIDALPASTSEYLCDELGLAPPAWLANVPACKIPWFVSGMENLKAIALVESPLRFRIRKIFVLENFLSRV